MKIEIDILPPLITDGIEHVIGITVNKTKQTITIFYNECIERHGDDKYNAPNYYKNEQITLPIELLKRVINNLKRRVDDI